MPDMSIQTISLLIAGGNDFEEVFVKATNAFNDRLKEVVERQNQRIVEMTQSHSSGYVPGQGFFCSIIATLQF